MPALAESKPKEASIIATLGGFEQPIELDRPEVLGLGGARPVVFRFAYRDVPFACTATRENGQPVLTLTGDFGAIPYTAAGRARRQAVQTVVAAAQRRSGLDWRVTPDQQIVMKGGISLTTPLTPVAVIAGAVAVLLRPPLSRGPARRARGPGLTRGRGQPGGNATTCPG